MTNRTDISKFSIQEMFSNSNGKTSNSAVVGTYLSFIGSITFIAGIILAISNPNNPHSPNILLQSLAFVGAGSALIMAKKLKPTKDTTNMNE